jgi:hypothetical protein
MPRPLLCLLLVVATACSATSTPTADGAGSDPTRSPSSASAAAGPEESAADVAGGTDTLPEAQPFFWQQDAEADPPTSVDLDEIISGGPPPDGIPPIDEPKYVSIDEADEWIGDTEPVIVVERGDQARAYPVQIMTYHEIVNDTLAGEPLLVTYCPLCNSGLAFDPTVRGQTLDFGTSGRLWQSNLVMYDRQTQSLWSQFTGQAIVGPLLEETLERVPLGLVSWADYRRAHPQGDVLSRDTGATRDYGSNPYVNYDSSSSPFLFRGETDDTLPQMARVVAFGQDVDPAAIPLDALQQQKVLNIEIDARPAVAFWAPGVSSALDSRQIADGEDVGATGVFDADVDGTTLTFNPGPDEGSYVDEQTQSTWDVLGKATAGELEGTQLTRLESDDTFWFVQFAFRPETRIVS